MEKINIKLTTKPSVDTNPKLIKCMGHENIFEGTLARLSETTEIAPTQFAFNVTDASFFIKNGAFGRKTLIRVDMLMNRNLKDRFNAIKEAVEKVTKTEITPTDTLYFGVNQAVIVGKEVKDGESKIIPLNSTKVDGNFPNFNGTIVAKMTVTKNTSGTFINWVAQKLYINKTEHVDEIDLEEAAKYLED